MVDAFSAILNACKSSKEAKEHVRTTRVEMSQNIILRMELVLTSILFPLTLVSLDLITIASIVLHRFRPLIQRVRHELELALRVIGPWKSPLPTHERFALSILIIH